MHYTIVSKKEKKKEITQTLKHIKKYAVPFIGSILLVLVLLFFTGTTDEENQRYLLSAAFQGLAAIYALVLTMVFVGIQLLTNKYSYRAINTILKGWSLTTIIVSYLLGLSILLYYLNNVPVSGMEMKSAMVVAILLILFSGMFIYYIFHSLKPKNILNLLEKEINEEKEEDLSESFQIFSDIVSKAIAEYDTETAKEGIKRITYLYIEKNARKEDEKTAEEFYRHLKTYLVLSRKAGNDWVTMGIVTNICTVLLYGHRVGKNTNIPTYFSSLLSDTIKEYKEETTVLFLLKIISNASQAAREIKREVQEPSFYLEEIIRQLTEALDLFSQEKSEEYRKKVEFVEANLYSIARDYAVEDSKTFTHYIYDIVLSLEKAKIQSYKNKTLPNNRDCFWDIHEIIKKVIESGKDIRLSRQLMEGMLDTINHFCLDGKTKNRHCYDGMGYFLKLCVLMIKNGQEEALKILFKNESLKMEDEQKNHCYNYFQVKLSIDLNDVRLKKDEKKIKEQEEINQRLLKLIEDHCFSHTEDETP